MLLRSRIRDGDHRQVIGASAVGRLLQETQRPSLHQLAIAGHQRLALVHDLAEPLKLVEAEAGLQIREPVIEAKLLLLVIPGARRGLFECVTADTAERKRCNRCTSTGSRLSAAPPSPVVMIFTG